MQRMEESSRPSAQESATTYRIVGRFLEACDCYAICPCWIDEEPDEERCTGLYVWDIADGEAKGNDVGGLRVASISYHEGNRRGSRQKVMLLIDERADDHQRRALSDVFTGRSGGPLAELGAMLGELVGQESARIDLRWEGQAATLDIEGKVRVSTESKVGPSGRVTTLVDSALAESFGSPALVGVSKELKLSFPDDEIEIDVRRRNANVGWFSYTG
jgi:hypothetical protein